jgi:hypothetical protein
MMTNSKINKQKLDKYELILISILILISSFFCFTLIKEGHNWGDDFSLYISETKAIINLDISTFYLENKFSILHSEDKSSPFLTPLGFPLILSPFFFLFGFNLILFKWVCALFFIATIPLIYFLFKKYFSNSFYVFFILIFISLHPQILKITDEILSDFPFLFFSLLSLFLITKKNTILNQIFIGICITFSFFIRDIGIVLIPTLFVYQLYQFKKNQINKKENLLLLIPFIIFFISYIFFYIILPPKGENQINIFISNINFNKAILSLRVYKKMIISFMYIQNYQFWTLLTFALFGIFSSFKQTIHFTVFFICYFLILLFWDTNQGLRFILPLIPIFLFFILKGSCFLFRKFRPSYLVIIFSLFLLRTTKINFVEIRILSKEDTNQAYTPEMKNIYRFISMNIKKNEIIACKKSRALRLNTNRITINSDLDYFRKSIANFLLIRKKDYKKNNYLTILSTENFILLKKS